MDIVKALANSGLKPTKIDKDGPLYRESDLNRHIAKRMNAGDYFALRAKRMTGDLEQATKLANSAADNLNGAISRFLDTEKRFADESKRVSGQVRDAADKLASGLAKVEKAADFSRLERYVALLERAAVAMQTLADLQATGKLERIASAIK